MSPAPDTSPETASETTQLLDNVHASVEMLKLKVQSMPASTQDSLRALVGSAFSIIACMRTDPRDIEHGSRFLRRYLTAVHTIVDTHLQLSAQGVSSPEITATLDRGIDMISRLQQAFAKEHARLLENDITDFSAELGTLDTLLKMNGN